MQLELIDLNINTKCRHCDRLIGTLGADEILRDGHSWGLTHKACTAPFLTKWTIISPLHSYTFQGA